MGEWPVLNQFYQDNSYKVHFGGKKVKFNSHGSNQRMYVRIKTHSKNAKNLFFRFYMQGKKILEAIPRYRLIRRSSFSWHQESNRLQCFICTVQFVKARQQTAPLRIPIQQFTKAKLCHLSSMLKFIPHLIKTA